MKTTTYTGLFKLQDGTEFTLKVNCFGFLSAFILLTAEAINQGKYHQLHSITNDKGMSVLVDDISKISFLFTEVK